LSEGVVEISGPAVPDLPAVSGSEASDAFRLALLVQMFDGYGIQANQERLAAYLAECRDVRRDEVFAEGLKVARREARDFPPGPGWVRAACSKASQTGPGQRSPAAPEQRRIEPPGYAKLHEVPRLAAEIRRTKPAALPANPDHFPQRLVSYVAAAIKLNVEWPLSVHDERRLTAIMSEARKQGRVTDWWDGERRRLVTSKGREERARADSYVRDR
jgi:hypothetical protein